VIRLHMTMQQLDTLDDILDMIPDLPDQYKRGIDMDSVQSIQQLIFYKLEGRKGKNGKMGGI
jgi:hypothetical protein